MQSTLHHKKRDNPPKINADKLSILKDTKTHPTFTTAFDAWIQYPSQQQHIMNDEKYDKMVELIKQGKRESKYSIILVEGKEYICEDRRLVYTIRN